MTRTRVLLADDHTMIADAFRNLLEPKYEVVATVHDGRAMIDTALATRPDVVVLDVGMPLLNGLTAGQQLKKQMLEVKIIFVTMNDDPDLAAEALRSGASGYLLKTSAASELLKSIHEVLRGGTYVTPQVRHNIEMSFIRSPQAEYAKTITPRQAEVLQLLSEGKSMKEVASELSITARTVAFHKYRMMELLNIRSNAELIQFAIRKNLTGAMCAAPPTRSLGKLLEGEFQADQYVGNLRRRNSTEV